MFAAARLDRAARPTQHVGSSHTDRFLIDGGFLILHTYAMCASTIFARDRKVDVCVCARAREENCELPCGRPTPKFRLVRFNGIRFFVVCVSVYSIELCISLSRRTQILGSAILSVGKHVAVAAAICSHRRRVMCRRKINATIIIYIISQTNSFLRATITPYGPYDHPWCPIETPTYVDDCSAHETTNRTNEEGKKKRVFRTGDRTSHRGRRSQRCVPSDGWAHEGTAKADAEKDCAAGRKCKTTRTYWNFYLPNTEKYSSLRAASRSRPLSLSFSFAIYI